ncbi:hypothetical protein QR680_003933 [Steinernema hermaphroditum]|uniref:Insulin-degrading enzyme n=1 Tax=Steinernema hermaphroditum TaxID=289476 RepID=A0AA39HM38_9BILA|nr:hypothetical protein QR680_003933 [Steinernema hermaphroditum]
MSASSSTVILRRFDNIKKSISDKREYRGLELSNGIKILLVSDPAADKSAASLDVNIAWSPSSWGREHLNRRWGSGRKRHSLPVSDEVADHGQFDEGGEDEGHGDEDPDIAYLSSAVVLIGTVRLGHLMDPKELPGLAHFCEHMLFLGTKKYPDENGYSAFISHSGGTSNAFTASESTNYHFDVAPEHLPEAMDRFNQFFVAPLFTESATEREVNAVNSEHTNNVQHDAWRAIQLERSLSKPGHDYGKFGTGNVQTLMEIPASKGINVRDQLLKFHSTYYSSNIMACCILGKESLDELEKMAMSLNFGDIENKNIKPKHWDEHCYGPEELGWRIDVVPVKDIRQLHLVFAVDDYKQYYKFQPGNYVSHLIGHEGKGSLLSELKRRGWATGLSAGPRTVARGIGFFDVQIELSEEGLKHAEEVIELIFHEIGTVKSAGAQKWIQDEIAGLGEIRFRFKDKESPLNYVTSLSGTLQDVPFEDVLSHNHLVEKYDPALIEKLVGQLTPHNMNYYVISKKTADLGNLTKEPHYGTEYKKSKLCEATIEKWEKALVTPHEGLYLPEKNEYIPSKFDLRAREEVKVEKPRLVRDDKIARVWYLQDDEFKLPKAQVHLSFTLPKMAADPLNTFLSAMYIMCFEDAIAEEVYNPILAGMKESVDITMKGLRLNFAGYDEKLHVFVADLVRNLVSYKADQKRYDLMMDRLVRNLKNFEQGQPYTQSQYYLNLLLTEKGWTKPQLLAMADIVNLDMINDFIPQIWRALHLEVFVHGNLSEDEAKSLTTELLDVVHENNSFVRPLFSNEMELIREMKIEEGTSHIYDHDQGTHANSCIDFVLQTGTQATRNNMLLELLVQIANEPAYTVLRTTEQLGYIVHTGARRANGAQSLEIIVQGSYDPKFMEERIEAFLKNFRNNIVEMKDEDYQRNVNALANRRLEKPKTLRALSNRYWHEIEGRQYSFNRSEIEVEDLRKITKDELLKFYDDKIMADSDKRQKLSVRVRSTVKGAVPEDNGKTVTEERGGTAVKDIERFKSLLATYPWPKPVVELPSAGADTLSASFKEKEKN